MGEVILIVSLLAVTMGLAQQKPLMRDFIGLNVHTVLFKPEQYRPVARMLRDYHGLEWDLGNSPANATQFPLANNKVNWNDLYSKWTKLGYDVNVTVQFEQFSFDKWTDLPKQAFAYGESFAKYFGPSGDHPFVNSFEIGNEPEKYTSVQYRPIFEHMAKGLRKGDPKLKISTCAVAVGDADQWSKDINGLKGLEPLYDVLNVHSYAMAEGWPTWRRSYPEDSKIKFFKQIQDLIDWRNLNAKGKEVWLTEFGWDSSSKKPPAEGDAGKWIGNTDTEQARYIVRSFLTLANMDVDRAYLYWFNDDDKPSLHAASGITRNYVPKPSFHAMAHLSKVLGDYRFEKVVSQKANDVYIYQFRAEKSDDRIWTVWSPTGTNRTATVTLPNRPGQFVKAERMPMTEKPPEEIKGLTGNELKIDESPVYIWFK